MQNPDIPVIILTAVVTVLLLLLLTVKIVMLYNKKILYAQGQIYHSIIMAQESERQRIGQDLHDEVGATLSMLKYQVQDSELSKDDFIVQLLNEAISTVKYVTHHLAPPGINEKPLWYSVGYLARGVSEKTKIEVNYSEETELSEITLEHKVEIYRIITEMFNNAIKHSKCTSIDLLLFEADGSLVVEFSDNGIGFDSGRQSDGIGLTGIMKRVGLMSGTCVIHSSTTGTHYKIELPINRLV